MRSDFCLSTQSAPLFARSTDHRSFNHAWDLARRGVCLRCSFRHLLATFSPTVSRSSPTFLTNQHSGLPICSAVLDPNFETEVRSFLAHTTESPEGNDGVPAFAGEGRTDRDGTAVIPAGDGGPSPERIAEATQESKDGGAGGVGHESDDELPGGVDGGKKEEAKGPSGAAQDIAGLARDDHG